MSDFYITARSFADGILMFFWYYKDAHVQFQGLSLVKTRYFKNVNSHSDDFGRLQHAARSNRPK
jgi:hypothetical protein